MARKGTKKQKREDDGEITLFSNKTIEFEEPEEEEREEEEESVEEEAIKSLGGKVPKLTEEKIKKDIEKLPSDDQLKILEEDSPDFLPLVKEFRKSVDELKQNITPLLQKLRTSRTPTSKGLKGKKKKGEGNRRGGRGREEGKKFEFKNKGEGWKKRGGRGF